jgi:Tol biopolymer transport system component
MNKRDDLDRVLSAWSDGAWAPPAPAYLDKVLARTRHTKQRPAWTSVERWLPMAVITARDASRAPLRLAWVLLITLLALALLVGALVAGGVIVGSRTSNATVAIPQGGAAVLGFDANGDLFTIRADGTDRQQLTSGPEQDQTPVWSPDGTHIAFRRTDANGTSVAVMDATGGALKLLYTAETPTNRDCFLHAPAWSPDSTWLVFPGDDCAGYTDLYVVPADGSQPAQTFLHTGTVGTAPTWTTIAGGTRITFPGRDAESEGIFVADIDSDRRVDASPPFDALRISDPVPTLHWVATDVAPLTAPSWSPRGTELVTAAGTNTDCRLPDVGSMDAFLLTRDPTKRGQSAVGPGDAKEYNPIWSPGGEHLALQQIVDPSRYVHGRPCTMEVWITDAQGANGSPLQTLTSDDSQPPLWSPDGTRIVGNTIRMVGGDEHYDLYVETIDGSSPVMTVEDVGFATWQPVVP